MKPVLIVGGGMITHDQILPALYKMQRNGEVGPISVCAQHHRTVKALAEAPAILKAFPGQSFAAFPEAGAEGPQPDRYKDLIRQLPPRSIVVVALPDQVHFSATMEALRHDQHVICVKPLVLTARESIEIENEARRRDLFVGVEYHKRFDDRSHKARQFYREGRLGEFKLGTARLMEKWYYRESNFQNWCTCENTDCFTYIGCHYVDLVHFITGLLPVAVSNYGIVDTYPNGNKGYLWCDTRVRWSNGAVLNLQTTLCYPNEGPGPNTQGMTLYCGGGTGAMLDHSDQYRGLGYTFSRKSDAPGATFHSEPSPDYFQYNDLGGPGLEPVGYGVRSVEHLVKTIYKVDAAQDRAALLRKIDSAGVLATPANSRYNELVVEAGRLSILNGGREALIEYSPAARACLP
ncbi:MAG: Gfo/Idh/MocA family oxidoreductase [Acidobacteria bacterium]|nr:Gfo/Idh/MocA family oxidoreductase [Acidobacteriota bacterium]